jgi:hypothetical protein
VVVVVVVEVVVVVVVVVVRIGFSHYNSSLAQGANHSSSHRSYWIPKAKQTYS